MYVGWICHIYLQRYTCHTYVRYPHSCMCQHTTYMCKISACVSDEYATYIYKYRQYTCYKYVRYPHICQMWMPHSCIRYLHVCQININILKTYMPQICKISAYMYLSHICVWYPHDIHIYRYPHACQMNMPHIFTRTYKIYMPQVCKIPTYMSDACATYMCKISACMSDEYATCIHKHIQDSHATNM